MSSSELPNTMAPNVQASTNANHDNQPSPSISPQHTAHDSSSPASTSTVRMSQADSNEGTGSATAAGARGGDRELGSGMDMPLPPVQAPSLQQAQTTATHSPPTTSLMVVQTISESPSSIASSVPRSIPSPGLQRPPSPPLPPPPPIHRPSQAAASRSNTGVSAPGRSLSFLDAAPPSRHGSTGARTNNNEYGPGCNNNSSNNNFNRSGNGSATTNACRNCDRRTMSSFTSSMEKAGTFLDQDPARAFHVDLEYGRDVDQRDPRHHDSGLSMPVPLSMGETLDNARQTDGGGDGNGRPHIRISATSDSIGVPLIPRTVQERLNPTINHATEEEVKYARKARISGYALNIAIGLQVFLSALITALSAVTTGRRTQIMTSVLGGAGTIVASYLARARGSNEPELSIARTKDLQRFIRTCDAFVQDHGLETGFEDSEGKQGGTRDLQRAKELDDRIRELRIELEHLLGNGDGERKLAPLV
ncbi:hypothetical protein ACEPAG_3277 [Sanghuangporus baumii]